MAHFPNSTRRFIYNSKIAIIKGGKLVTSGTTEDVRGNTSLEQVFLELEGTV